MFPKLQVVDESETRGGVQYVFSALHRFVVYTLLMWVGITALLLATGNVGVIITYLLAPFLATLLADGYDAWVLRKSYSGDTWYLAYESGRA